MLHNLAAERARRGLLPWDFVVDLARDHFEIRIRHGASLLDLAAMADACEQWARALRNAAKTLRAFAQSAERG
ncbi:MAG: hypothetical protein ACREU5_12705 [Burkholderiales bacterium]